MHHSEAVAHYIILLLEFEWIRRRQYLIYMTPSAWVIVILD